MHKKSVEGFGDTVSKSGKKRHLTIGGRRIRVQDLIEAELLKPGEVLVFSRPRRGERFQATVEADGSLTVDGETFTSLSSAAAAVAGVTLDGWHAWQVGDEGPYIHKLRERLLEKQQAEPAETQHDIRIRERQRFLASVDEDGKSLTVLALLQLWGASTRSQLVTDEIEADLTNYDLVTTPNYLKVGVEDTVVLHRRRVQTDDEEEVAARDDSPGLDEVGITLGNIRAARSDVISVSPNSTLDEAITEMYLRDFSQLPVLAGPKSVKGAVTWQSIARARNRSTKASLRDAMVEAREYAYDTELIDVLADLQKFDFVLVKGPQNELQGIVTNADVVEAYGALATPFLLIGELDQILRRVLINHVDIDTVRSICVGDTGRPVDGFGSLTMFHYETVLRDADVWASLRWPFDQKTLLKNLAELRDVRNDVMHFNRDAVPPGIVNRFRQMIALLRDHVST